MRSINTIANSFQRNHPALSFIVHEISHGIKNVEIIYTEASCASIFQLGEAKKENTMLV